MTAVGEKNYFFRERSKNAKDFIFNNDRNKTEMSDVEEAYKEIEKNLDIRVLKLGYIPVNLKIKDVDISQERAILRFAYQKITYILYKGSGKILRRLVQHLIEVKL